MAFLFSLHETAKLQLTAGMNHPSLMIAGAQVALVSGAMIMAFWTHVPRPALWAFGIQGAALLLCSITRRPRFQKWSVLAAWAFTPVALLALPFFPSRIHTLDVYQGVMAWLVAIAIVLTVRLIPEGPCRTWVKVLAFLWVTAGTCAWVAASYLNNDAIVFRGGLLIGLALIIGCKRFFRMPTFGIQLANTLILVTVGLPVVDLLTRPSTRLDGHLALANRYYSYRAARQNPAAFHTWWNNYLIQWDLMAHDVFMPDAENLPPFRLRPNADGFLFESRIHINSKGFRGKEFRDPKGDAYRIVAIGESTTFGCTLRSEDRPWPDLLEEIILERLKPHRPVEVINAGVPSYSLQSNLRRIPAEILPLEPDMIISYHGANGLYLLDEALPKSFGKLPPSYKRRPVKLLADCEYRFRMIHFRRRLDPKKLIDPSGFSNPLATRYAEGYRQLVQIAKTNRIRLILGNYAMAVNSQSDSDVVEFYRTASPSIHWQIRGNAVHTEIVKQLAAQHVEVCFVNTHLNLDGDTEKFIDMGHFTQSGRQQIAENFFAGIRSILESDLAGSSARNYGGNTN